MHPSLLLLSLLLILPGSDASRPPFQHFRFPTTRRFASTSLEKQIEVTRPLPFDSLTPACTLPLFNHTFAHTSGLPPSDANYSAPLNCTWSNAVLRFSAAANGTQSDRIAAVWLAGAELLRTSTPQSTPDGVSWSFTKDVTRFSALLRRKNLSLSVMLENTVDEFYTGAFDVNITFLFYNVRNSPINNRRSLNSSPRKIIRNHRRRSTALNASLELDEIPADLIIPVSAAGEEGYWFKIQNGNDAVYQGIQIPNNTYRAVIEVFVSAHGDDELWYTNPPDFYIESNGLNITRGHGVYREVLVTLGGNVVGSVLPFPVIYAGGINPFFWSPIVAIGAFNLPSYEIELTPFLGILLDDKKHYFGFGVADAISFWLVDANLHLWLDDGPVKVQAGSIKYKNPNNCVERESSFAELNGKFETEGERKTEFSGWVYSSAGNLTTSVTTKLEFENEINYKSNGTIVKVEHEVTVKKQIEISIPSSGTVASYSVESEYELELKTTSIAGAGPENFLVSTDLEISYEEEKEMGDFESELENKQECSGWMFVHGDDVLSGAGATSQSYEVEDSHGCYTRKISADQGAVVADSQNFLCALGRVSGSSA
ncbi:hypothetical protein SASPL_146052 [Salvia splendens]|uniref:Peptide N-acetyl-beta-D-glucosaminyl asparaginase amidase A N-terminal domain-containing protein n=1 Tax=Salvia splendens TaxID=180675 RepID=A0A8X8WI60_SALSN|nr:peptide-N4-(N-acetyl-beta-glucosaminyl)asparagine amidase A-like [Salvia splendens]KAG6395407.1 hypothetical protein SASPL_146052 [Salvia splendens]